ncbi:hypothetical protein ABPG72_005230 [Tetrahymena utriculariae]
MKQKKSSMNQNPISNNSSEDNLPIIFIQSKNQSQQTNNQNDIQILFPSSISNPVSQKEKVKEIEYKMIDGSFSIKLNKYSQNQLTHLQNQLILFINFQEILVLIIALLNNKVNEQIDDN